LAEFTDFLACGLDLPKFKTSHTWERTKGGVQLPPYLLSPLQATASLFVAIDAELSRSQKT
jgi:hypothetical protein